MGRGRRVDRCRGGWVNVGSCRGVCVVGGVGSCGGG